MSEDIGADLGFRNVVESGAGVGGRVAECTGIERS